MLFNNLTFRLCIRLSSDTCYIARMCVIQNTQMVSVVFRMISILSVYMFYLKFLFYFESTTIATRYVACMALDCPNVGIVGSNTTRGIYIQPLLSVLCFPV